MTEGEKQHDQPKTDSEEDGHLQVSIPFPRHPVSARLYFGRPPFDGAEPRVAEEVVGDAPGSNGLVTCGDKGRGRIPARHDVLDPEPVAFVNAYGKRRVSAEDALRSIRLGGTEAADVVFACRQVEHGLVAEDQAAREKPLTCPAVVVVALLGGVDGARRAVSDSAERRALKCNRTREPPLGLSLIHISEPTRLGM